MDRFLEVVELSLLEAQLGHVELQIALVEETQHDLLAEERRQHGNTKVHLAATAHLQLDASILRQRRSAMSSSLMILTRDVSAFFSFRGGFMTS